MIACPVGGVSVTIIVTAVADSGMYLDTSTLIGVGSTGASGGASSCASCTTAGGGCRSMLLSLRRQQLYQVRSCKFDFGGLTAKLSGNIDARTAARTRRMRT